MLRFFHGHLGAEKQFLDDLNLGNGQCAFRKALAVGRSQAGFGVLLSRLASVYSSWMLLFLEGSNRKAEHHCCSRSSWPVAAGVLRRHRGVGPHGL